MDKNNFDKWVSVLGKAWVDKNPDLIGSICSDDVVYFEHPFEKPRMGRQAVIDEWQNVPQSQKDIEFSYDIIGVIDDVGVAHWTASFKRIPSEVSVRMDGIFTVKLNGEGLCTEFHMWWVVEGN